jgi:redox-sensitive bicupin YhaK (pirin superfamily)
MSAVIATVPLGLHWPTLDPFLFCAHHNDHFPPGNEAQGVDDSALLGRQVGSDFTIRDGWRMYHGRTVPGFPQHPHRGFETVTIARQGFIDHADSMGAQSRFGQGDVQWMTAGRGVVHAEMFPLINPVENNPAELFQIWLNLPAKHKMVDPYFTMIWNEQVPRMLVEDEAGHRSEITLVSGAHGGSQSTITPPHSWAADPAHGVNIWTISMAPHARWSLPATGASFTRVLYAFSTQGLTVDDATITQPVGLQLQPHAEILVANGPEHTELLLLEGQPINEPVAHHGPFVMNTRQELQQAFEDYQRTSFGGWPWDRNDPVLPRETGRFAKHADGRLEQPDPAKPAT